MPTIHILLPVHNRVLITRRFARLLRAQEAVDSHLILIDDGCTDGTAEAVAIELGDRGRLTVLRGDGSLWWAGALQKAYRYLQAHPPAPQDGVLIINDDVQFDPDFLARGLALLTGNRRVAWQAMGIDQRTGRIDRGVIADLRHLSFRGTTPGERPNCLSTRGLLMAREVFLDSGGLHPRWLPHYLSDYEFTLRLARQGVGLGCDEIFHLRTDSTLTGDDEYAQGNVSKLLSSAFSFRSKRNPKHWSAFALLACPKPIGILHAAKIWARFSWTLLRTGLGAPSPRG